MRFLLRAFKMGWMRISYFCCTLAARFQFSLHGVQYGADFRSRGLPLLDISLKGIFKIGDRLQLNNAHYYNLIGRQQRCFFCIGSKGRLTIGNDVGMSCCTIVCKSSIEIGDFVHIGGNCEIYDSDFHDLDFKKRSAIPEDYSTVKEQPVVIRKHAFIGAHTTILKGVTVGEGAIIGACSVVTKDIPAFEIWGGNPIRFLAPAPNAVSKLT